MSRFRGAPRGNRAPNVTFTRSGERVIPSQRVRVRVDTWTDERREAARQRAREAWARRRAAAGPRPALERDSSGGGA